MSAGLRTFVRGALARAGAFCVKIHTLVCRKSRNFSASPHSPALAEEISKGTFDIDVRPTPLTDVGQTRTDAAQVTP